MWGPLRIPPLSPGPYVQPETDRFYLTAHLRAAATQLLTQQTHKQEYRKKKRFTGTNGQRINTFTYQTVNSFHILFYFFCFFFFFLVSLVLVSFSRFSHQDQQSSCLFSVEPGTTMPSRGELVKLQSGHRTRKLRWKPFWTGWVKANTHWLIWMDNMASSQRRGMEVASWGASRPPHNNPRSINALSDPSPADSQTRSLLHPRNSGSQQHC